MTPKRVAVYLVCATIPVAWLASASGLIEQAPAPAADPVPVQTAGTETLAEEVQAQAGRLREHLTSAPTPQQPARNPFAFAPRVPAARRAPAAAAATEPAAAIPMTLPEPALLLVGVAEDQTPGGPVRTAIITAEGGETLIVKAGEFLGARYKVHVVGADAVELIDLTSHAIRRLALR